MNWHRKLLVDNYGSIQGTLSFKVNSVRLVDPVDPLFLDKVDYIAV